MAKFRLNSVVNDALANGNLSASEKENLKIQQTQLSALTTERRQKFGLVLLSSAIGIQIGRFEIGLLSGFMSARLLRMGQMSREIGKQKSLINTILRKANVPMPLFCRLRG